MLISKVCCYCGHSVVAHIYLFLNLGGILYFEYSIDKRPRQNRMIVIKTKASESRLDIGVRR